MLPPCNNLIGEAVSRILWEGQEIEAIQNAPELVFQTMGLPENEQHQNDSLFILDVIGQRLLEGLKFTKVEDPDDGVSTYSYVDGATTYYYYIEANYSKGKAPNGANWLHVFLGREVKEGPQYTSDPDPCEVIKIDPRKLPTFPSDPEIDNMKRIKAICTKMTNAWCKLWKCWGKSKSSSSSARSSGSSSRRGSASRGSSSVE
ncbi:uncharacterized protein LOC135842132 [Planococcus citri]|uniref:uncharacterized protein LOC135842132 n=1 Tax=Planococcus citri TaxID=170843 RepID=UPI0031F7F7DC